MPNIGFWAIAGAGGGGAGPYFFMVQQDSVDRQITSFSAITADLDSNIYWGNTRYDASYNQYPTIIKLSDNGTLQWTTTLTGNTNNILQNLKFKASALYAFGKYYGGGSPSSLGYYAKINASTGAVSTSSLISATDYGFTYAEMPNGDADADGNTYTATNVYSSGYGSYRYVVAKLNSSNVQQWARYSTWGYNSYNFCHWNGSNLFISPQNSIIMKLDASGNSTKTSFALDNGSGYLGQNNKNIASDTSGNLYLLNENGGFGSVSNGLAFRFGAGTGGSISSAYENGVTVDKDNNAYFFWKVGSSAYIVKTNSSGTVQWQRRLDPKLGGGSTSASDYYISTDPATGDLLICWTYATNPWETAMVKLPADGTLTGTYSVSSGGYSWGFTWGTLSMSVSSVTATQYSANDVSTMTANQSNNAISTRSNPSFTYNQTTIV